MITVTKKVQLRRSAHGRRRMADKPQSAQVVPPGRVPRVARVMALALQFGRLLQGGTVANTVELARLAKVTQPRITQVLSLLQLASDIQEDVLFLSLVAAGRDPVNEKQLRRIAAEVRWQKQRLLWLRIKPGNCGMAEDLSGWR